MKDRTALYKDQLLPIILNHVDHCTVYLFGSRARVDHLEGADIDIAIDAGSPIDPRMISKIKQDIEDSTVPVFVDVVDVYAISDRMRKEIEQDWIVWNE